MCSASRPSAVSRSDSLGVRYVVNEHVTVEEKYVRAPDALAGALRIVRNGTSISRHRYTATLNQKGCIEQVTFSAWRTGVLEAKGQQVTVPLFAVAEHADLFTATLTRTSGRSVRVRMRPYEKPVEMTYKLDAAGRIVSGGNPAAPSRVERIP